ncbi:MAG: damage-control phosphatase ARMT1 family protein [Methanoculleaceae archaeon]
MLLTDECPGCILSRVEYECRSSTDDEELIGRTVRACEELLNRIRHDPYPAPVIASRIHRLAMEMLGDPDPYRRIKERNNRDAAALCRQVRDDLDSFRSVVLASVIANTMDYGVRGHVVSEDLASLFEREFRKGLDVDHTDRMLELADRVVYLTDNCGEIVFDRLLIEALIDRGAEVTVAVRGAPILNDATMEDAEFAGIDRAAPHLTTTSSGIAELGWNPCYSPSDLTAEMERASLIVAKGMANYESLTEYPDLPPVAHLMTVKCDPIGRHSGIPKGSRVALLREGDRLNPF